jgi:phytol kinase
MDPIFQNTLSMMTMFAYISTVVAVCDWAVARRVVSLLISRKIVHIAAACNIFFLTLFNQDHWTWRLCIVVPSLYAVQLIVKGLILADPNDVDVKTMSRTGRPIELCQGPLLFVLVLIYTSLFEFKTAEGSYIMAAMGFGDGIAPVVGVYHPWLRYQSGREFKTVSMSMGMFVDTILGVLGFRAAIGEPAVLPAYHVVGIALVATVAEAISGKWDNIFIALTVWAFLKLSQ